MIKKKKFKILCGGCMKGKLTVDRFPYLSQTRTSSVLVPTDVMGPMETNSKGDAKYALTFVDDHSRYVVAYFLRAKAAVLTKFKESKLLYERQRNSRVKCLRSDNGSEFVNKAMDKNRSTNGIVH